MPKGPQGQKRPADVIGAAVMVGQDRDGEASETVTLPKSAAVELGSKGGKTLASNLDKKRRSEIARKAARSRWVKK